MGYGLIFCLIQLIACGFKFLFCTRLRYFVKILDSQNKTHRNIPVYSIKHCGSLQKLNNTVTLYQQLMYR